MRARDARWLLILAAVITVVAWQFPIGQRALYPFTLLATFAHEMGHGLTALIVGGHFDALEMHADGSGLARWRGDVGALGRALVAAGGLVGPSIAGVLVLIASRNKRHAAWIIAVLAGFMALTVVLWARSLFAVAFIGACAAVLIAVARWGRETVAPFFVQLVGVQLCLAVFRDVDYMFSPGAVVGGVAQLSDSSAIADALIGPYWFWGGLTALVSFVVLVVGLYVALRPHQTGTPAPALN